MPIGHGEGTTAPAQTLEELGASGVTFRYCDARGNAVDAANPNGAARAHRRHREPEGNVVGLMPHRTAARRGFSETTSAERCSSRQ
jgi:phosphoribosylformylglycinamidine synthase